MTIFKKRVAIIAIIYVLIFQAMGCVPKPKIQESLLDTPENHFKQGMREFEMGNLNKALDEFTRSKELDPKYPQAYVGFAYYYGEKGDYEKAFTNIKKAKSLDEKCVDAFIASGRLYTKQREGKKWIKKSEKEFHKALDLSPSNEETYFYLAIAYKLAYQFRNAERMLGEVIELRGRFREMADEEWRTVQKIVRAAPGSQVGSKIALVEKIDRADFAVLLIEELKLSQFFKPIADQAADIGFQPPKDPRVIELENKQPIKSPSDIEEHWAKNWIEDILEIGGMSTFPDKTFRPDELLTKAELAIIVHNILVKAIMDEKLKTKYIGEISHFSDMDSEHPAYTAAVLTVERGIIRTKGDGSFGIMDPVSGADSLLIVRQLENSLRPKF